MQGRSHGSHDHAQTLAGICCSADDGEGFSLADVHLTNLQTVGIGMLGASRDFADDESAQPSGNALDGFNTFDFQPCGGEHSRSVFSRGCDRQQVFEPLKRDFHRY